MLHPMKYHFKIFAVILFLGAPHFCQAWHFGLSVAFKTAMARHFEKFDRLWMKLSQKISFFLLCLSTPVSLLTSILAGWHLLTNFPRQTWKVTLNTAQLLPHYQNDSLSKTHTHITGRNKRKKSKYIQNSHDMKVCVQQKFSLWEVKLNEKQG